MSADLDVVIVSYNTRALLVACLTSLFEHRPSRLGTVWVVDNASTDGSAEAVRAAWPSIQLTRLDRNAGFGAANNMALRASTAPFVLLLNSDTVVPAGALDILLARLEATGAAAAGPYLADASGRPEISFGPMLTPFTEFRQAVLGRLASSEFGPARRYVARRLAIERDVDWVTGACLLLRRDVAEAAGFFDERYFLYEEDVDLCAAIRAHGGRVLFTPDARVTHLRGQSRPAGEKAAHGQYDRSHIAFYLKHAPHWAPWLRLSLRVRGRSIR